MCPYLPYVVQEASKGSSCSILFKVQINSTRTILSKSTKKTETLVSVFYLLTKLIKVCLLKPVLFQWIRIVL